jgi:uncharacterized protein YebE (UPF0316 family)
MEDLGWFLYVIIFVAKMVEVSVGVFRLLLMTKGFRKQATLIVFFEQMIWVINVSIVITGITNDPLRILAYAAGFATGLYFGSWLEGKVGLGNIKVEIIADKPVILDIANQLRNLDIAVTLLDSSGMKGHHNGMLISYIPRKRRKEVTRLVAAHPEAVVTYLDIRPIQGGYGHTRSH